MITAQDAEFHERDTSIDHWAETRYITFSIPEEQMMCEIYVLSRPNIGVITSDIMIQKGIGRHAYQADFHDPQVHLRCPASFTKFRLNNGLSVECIRAPYDYHYSYQHNGGSCSFELDFTAVGEPFDCHDPQQNPLLGDETFSGLGDQWLNGHYDVLGHVTGTLELRGKTYKVDSYDGADHSWGPRLEEGKRAIGWTAVSFGEDYGMHLVTAADIRHGQIHYDKLRFGFVVEDGQTYGLTDAKIEATHIDLLGVNNHIVATDVRGKVHEFYGTAIASHPNYSLNPCQAVFETLYRYQLGDRIGHGMSADCFGLDFLSEHMAPTGRKR